MTNSIMEKVLSVFIYYKIQTSEHQHYLAALRQVKKAIEERYPTLQISHQKRPELDEENRELWMETYHGVAHQELESFTMVLTQLAEKYGLPGTRKHEVFASL